MKTVTELNAENEELRDLLDFFIADVWVDPSRSCQCPNGHPPCSFCTDVRPLKEALNRAETILGNVPEDEVWSLTPPQEEGTYRFSCEESGEEVVWVGHYGVGEKAYYGCTLDGLHNRVDYWHYGLTSPKWKRIYDPSIRIRELERKLALEVKENLKLRK